MEEACRIRIAERSDGSGIASLNRVLGRSSAETGIRTDLHRIREQPGEVVLVAESDSGAILGWIHGSERQILGAGRRCEIVGLVVDPDARGQGIGRQLVDAIEAWSRSRGLEQVLVRSNVVRPDAHPFYHRLGYERTKTQHVYRKHLPDARDPGGDRRSSRPTTS